MVVSYVLFIFIAEQYLASYYIDSKTSQLAEIAIAGSTKSSQHIFENAAQKLPGVIIFTIDGSRREQPLNAEIRENLVKNRIQFNKIWFPIEKINQALNQQPSYYTAQQPLLGSHLLAVIFQSKDSELMFAGLLLVDVNETLAAVKTFFGYLAIVALICISLAISIFSARITRPITQLVEKSQRMAMLDFTEPVHVNRNDEIAILAQSVNKLAVALKRSLSELNQKTAMLERDVKNKTQIDELRRDFIGNASHELKTPIALISGYAHGLLDNVSESSERTKYCDVIIDETNKMSDLVDELLAVLESETKASSANIETYDIAPQVSAIIDRYRLELTSKSVKCDFDNSTKVLVVADSNKIERALSNLFSNAMRSVNHGGEITIRFEKEEESIMCRIFNTGSVIDENLIDDIWQPFIQGNEDSSTTHSGSGLGLAITANILKQHGSEYGVANLSAGVEFYFSLPAA